MLQKELREWSMPIVKTLTILYKNFIYNISLNITSANLTKKAICTWLANKKQ